MGRGPAGRVGQIVIALALLLGAALGGRPVPVAIAVAAPEGLGAGARTIVYGDDTPVATYVPPPGGGARAQAAAIEVTYVGFSAEARVAFQRAVDIWATQINSGVAIAVRAEWADLGGCGTGCTILGAAGPENFWRNFPGAPRAATWYPSALANALSGADLDPAADDIAATFNSTVAWYYGDGPTPGGQMNFTSVVLHELGHGLGLTDSSDVSGQVGRWGQGTATPFIYDRFVVNGAGQPILDTARFPNPSVALGAQLTGADLFFDGPNARAAAGGRPRLYAPAPFQAGSSVAHLDEATYSAGGPNALMTPSLHRGEAVYNPGPIALGILRDLGWATAAGAPSPSPTPSPTAVPTPQPSASPSPGATPRPSPSTSPTPPPTSSPAPLPSATPPPAPTPICTGRFGDVGAGDPACAAIEALAARGIINGCDSTATPPLFCPADGTLRAQLAALIVRAMPGWATETGLPIFTDNTADTELMTRVATLQRHGVVGGYNDCAAQGKAVPCYGPTDPVLRAQAISFITRALVAKGYWQQQPTNPALYGGVLLGTGHEGDATTYWHYTRALGGVPDYPETGPFPTTAPASRAWFARLLWLALQSTPLAAP